MGTARDTGFIFFSGKGGVGKTTMAAATAVHEAGHGRKTLIVTTDRPPTWATCSSARSAGVPNLWAMEIDPDRATEEYRERVVGPMRAAFPPDVVQVVEEQFRSPCTTEIASFDRFVDFMDGPDFDVVIFDTAPTGHTLRLLELPVDWSRHIEESARGSGRTCIGPVQAIHGAKVNRAGGGEAGEPGRRGLLAHRQRSPAAGGVRRPLLPPPHELQQRHLAEIQRRFPVPTRIRPGRRGSARRHQRCLATPHGTDRDVARRSVFDQVQLGRPPRGRQQGVLAAQGAGRRDEAGQAIARGDMGRSADRGPRWKPRGGADRSGSVLASAFLRAAVCVRDGEFHARVDLPQQAGALSSLARSNALVRLEPGAGPLPAGTPVTALLRPGWAHSSDGPGLPHGPMPPA